MTKITPATLVGKKNGVKTSKKGSWPPLTASTKNNIRRPENCFMLFKKAFARAYGKNFRFQQDVCKAAARAWHAMTEEEKAPWRERSQIVKEAHARRYPDYVYRPIRKGKKIQKESDVQADSLVVVPYHPPTPVCDGPPLLELACAKLGSFSQAAPSVHTLTMSVPQVPGEIINHQGITDPYYKVDSSYYTGIPDPSFDEFVSQADGPLGIAANTHGQYSTTASASSSDLGFDWNRALGGASSEYSSLFNIAPVPGSITQMFDRLAEGFHPTLGFFGPSYGAVRDNTNELSSNGSSQHSSTASNEQIVSFR